MDTSIFLIILVILVLIFKQTKERKNDYELPLDTLAMTDINDMERRLGIKPSAWTKAKLYYPTAMQLNNRLPKQRRA